MCSLTTANKKSVPIGHTWRRAENPAVIASFWLPPSLSTWQIIQTDGGEAFVMLYLPVHMKSGHDCWIVLFGKLIYEMDVAPPNSDVRTVVTDAVKWSECFDSSVQKPSRSLHITFNTNQISIFVTAVLENRYFDWILAIMSKIRCFMRKSRRIQLLTVFDVCTSKWHQMQSVSHCWISI